MAGCSISTLCLRILLVLIKFTALFDVAFFICNHWLKKKSPSQDDDLHNLKDVISEVSILGIETDPIAVKILITSSTELILYSKFFCEN